MMNSPAKSMHFVYNATQKQALYTYYKSLSLFPYHHAICAPASLGVGGIHNRSRCFPRKSAATGTGSGCFPRI